MVVGPMFAKKTTWLIKKYQRAQSRNQSVCAIKPSLDCRYYNGEISIVTHDGLRIPAISLCNMQGVLQGVGNASHVYIDEGQFFPDLVDGCDKLAAAGKHVYVAALNGTAEQHSWPIVAELMAHADMIRFLAAGPCARCGHRTAPFTARRPTAIREGTIQVGGADVYEPVCRKCVFV